ncbi:MAG: redoxin domain-containing protein [Alphaproteobacteria bacterium]|nr:redoxin domain-containing protein [Alphaproteobacteria bacterium]
MTRTIFAIIALLGLSLQSARAEPSIGQLAPAFTAIDSNGKSRSLSDFAGKTVILEWTNDGCPYVKKHYNSGNMQKLQQELTSKGAVWLSIISSAPGKQGHVNGAGANQLSASRSANPTAVLLDPTGMIGRAYDAQTTPHMFVIDKTGKLRYMGAIDDQPSTDTATIATARNYVREAFAAVRVGHVVKEKATDAYGCSVKY